MHVWKVYSVEWFPWTQVGVIVFNPWHQNSSIIVYTVELMVIVQSSKWKVEFTGPNRILQFIFI
jgi:hypothetical protein